MWHYKERERGREKKMNEETISVETFQVLMRTARRGERVRVTQCEWESHVRGQRCKRVLSPSLKHQSTQLVIQ